VLDRKAVRLRILQSLALATAIGLRTGSAMAAGPGATGYRCAGGDFTTGTFTTIPLGESAIESRERYPRG
jgi:hypothetical protein